MPVFRCVYQSCQWLFIASCRESEEDIQKYLAENKNPPVPRFEHPTPKLSNEHELIPKKEKKPRPPVVPDHLRKTNESPTPFEDMQRRSQEEISSKVFP